MSHASTAIEIHGVSKSFRRQGSGGVGVHTLKSFFVRDLWRGTKSPIPKNDALVGVSANISVGSTFGVIGRNGSGKSTLLKLMTRILRPDEGKISVRGRVAAIIELGAGFHPELTGRENILINSIILGLSRARVREKMNDIIDFSGLREFIDEPVRTYSSGMYARLGFSVAVHVDPDVLLIDEVLAVGDAEFSQQCIEKLKEFKEAGKTIVIVTHDVAFVLNWCDEAMWLDHGHVRALGSTDDVISAYRADFKGVP